MHTKTMGNHLSSILNYSPQHTIALMSQVVAVVAASDVILARLVDWPMSAVAAAALVVSAR